MGAGRWGKRYIATISAMENVRLVHLASTNPESASLVRPDCRLSRDWHELTTDKTLDGIILATPPATHAEMALEAIARGIPVLVEKPMTLSVNDAHAVVEQARRAGVLVMVDHTHLFSCAFRTLEARGASLGDLSRTRSSGGNWGPFRRDTPVLWDWGPHDVAMCLALFGATPLRVEARRASVAQSGEGTGEAIEIELGFGARRSAEIRISNIEDRKRRHIEATYTGGTLVYDDLAVHKLTFMRSPSSGTEVVPLDTSLPLTNVVSEFCRRIESGESSNPSLDLGLQVVEILVACEMQLVAANVRQAG
ncbi:MAG: Gfo/Idh/MocA family oxidoreductase [Burkholderiales bacterium]|nr:Gfo/Idh/MocA family oxidoreductase [Burkholderiales bacterium]